MKIEQKYFIMLNSHELYQLYLQNIYMDNYYDSLSGYEFYTKKIFNFTYLIRWYKNQNTQDQDNDRLEIST